MDLSIKSAAKKLPKKPIHLHAELIWSEDDGLGIKTSALKLCTELEGARPSFAVTSYIPYKSYTDVVIAVNRGSDSITEHPSERERAVFEFKADEIISDGDAVVTDYEKVFMRGRVSRRPLKSAILAWAILRVAEYAKAVINVSGDIEIYDAVTGGECAAIAECCAQGLRAVASEAYAKNTGSFR